jgi:hypothetical protein
MLLVAAFLIASAPPTGAAEATLVNDGTTTAIRAAAISFVIVFDMGTPLNESCSALSSALVATSCPLVRRCSDS